ncbi:MAG: hypothetical protein WD076_00465 [Parvularculaceae bacterium]
MSELEGAILGEIARAGAPTAYAVRKTFAASPSTMLSASKGAIYPAIARLIAAALIEARGVAGDDRGTQTLRLTARGERAMRAWAMDPKAAAGAGIDPFRTRAGHWAYLSDAERAALYARIRDAIAARIIMLKKHRAEVAGDPDDVRAELEIALQEMRLAYLDTQKKSNRKKRVGPSIS